MRLLGKIIVILVLLAIIIAETFFILSYNLDIKFPEPKEFAAGENVLVHSPKPAKEPNIDNIINEPELIINEIKEAGEIEIEEDDRDYAQRIIEPDVIQAVYLTSWSASSSSYINYIINLTKRTEINALVVDIKDFSGYVAYDTDIEQLEEYWAEQRRIYNIDSFIDNLHKNGIYVIARITVFQDPVLARFRPDLAIHSNEKISETDSSSDFSLLTLWFDNKGLAWIDPASQEAWDYNIAVAKDAVSRGFDEINFDYIRFPSDGDLSDMVFPFWDSSVEKHLVIKDFFKKLRQELPDIKISADLFGLAASASDDLGIGQIIEDFFEYFDYVCPMAYPSHYEPGFRGFENPAEHPYEVIKYSMESALRRLKKYGLEKEIQAKLRPWLQDFNLGADYNVKMVRDEINAVYDALGEDYSGFMLWSPSNYYTEQALISFDSGY